MPPNEFGDIDQQAIHVDQDGIQWTVCALGAGGYGAGDGIHIPPVTECTLAFSASGRRRLTHHAPMRWNTPETIAQMFIESEPAPDERFDLVKDAAGVKTKCYIMPNDGKPYVGDLSEKDRLRLRYEAFGEFTLKSGIQTGYMYVAGWPCEIPTNEFSKAARGIFTDCQGFIAYRPDGTQVVP